MAAPYTQIGPMTALLVIFLSVVTRTLGSSEFVITHAPTYAKFIQNAGNIASSEIPKLITTSYGFSTHQDLTWKGMAQTSLFQRPKATVVVSMEGLSDLKQHKLNVKHVAKYDVNVDDPVLDTEPVVNRILSSSFETEPLIVDFSVDNTVFDIRSQHPHLFRDLPATISKVKSILTQRPAFLSLNTSQAPDLLFLGEMEVLDRIVKALQANPAAVKDSTPDWYHFKVAGIQRLIQEYGASSFQVQDAVKLLGNLLSQMTEDFKEMYNGNVIIEYVTLPALGDKPVRKTRSLLATPTKAKTLEKAMNVASAHDENYPVIFNIILWTMIILGLTVYGIAYGIWNMDPGRDSIIYRMTSQRMKKD